MSEVALGYNQKIHAKVIVGHSSPRSRDKATLIQVLLRLVVDLLLEVGCTEVPRSTDYFCNMKHYV
jgi:hypothetical protein